MDILVCVKRVPDTTDAEIVVRADGKGLRDEDLAFGIGEWDGCAVEEAIRLTERHGGTVTVATLGPEESEEMLRRCLAMGAGGALRIDAGPFGCPDPHTVARALAALVRRRTYDLVLTGALSGDDGYGITGPVLAGHLGWPHATLVTSVEVEGRGEGGRVVVSRELEEGLEERLALALPAVLTIQTGINEPRYVSIMGIRKVRSKEIPVLSPAELGLRADELGEAGSRLHLLDLSTPGAARQAVFLTGAAEEIARSILHIVEERAGGA